MEHQQNLLDVLKTIFKWKKTILYICAAALIGSIIFSLMKDDYYQATTLFYAANHDLAKPSPIGENRLNRNYYGNGEDIDRIMTICQSSIITEHLIQKFNLLEHYHIDTSSLKSRAKVFPIFNSYYNVTKTKFDAIEIAMEAIDPKLAADIANEARIKINDTAQDMIKQSQKKEILAYEDNIKSKQQQLVLLSDSLNTLRTKYGIFNTDNQSRDLPKQVLNSKLKHKRIEASLEVLRRYPQIDPDTIIFLEADLSGINQEIIMAEERLDLFQQGVSIYEQVYRLHQLVKDQIGIDANMLQQLQAAYDSDFTAIHLVEKATPPAIKSRPKRSIIVLSSIFIALIFSIIGVLIFDAYKDINWREIVNG